MRLSLRALTYLRTVSLTMWGTGQRGQDVLPLSCHAYYGLDMSRDILKGAKSVEFKLQWFDEYGCQREHYRIRNLDNGCWDIRMDRSDPGGRGGKYFSICSYTFRNIWMMPDYGGGGEDPRSFEERHAVGMQQLRSMYLSIVRHWDGSDKIVVYDLEKNVLWAIITTLLWTPSCRIICLTRRMFIQNVRFNLGVL